MMKELIDKLTEFENIPPKNSKPDKKECMLAREVYEFATFLSVE